MDQRSLENDFKNSIDWLLRFKNPEIEEKYLEERFKNNNNLKVVTLSIMFFWFSISTRALYACFQLLFVANPNSKSNFNYLIMAIVGFCSIILEILLLFIKCLRIIKGFIYSIPISLIIMYITYQANIALNNSSPYFPPPVIPMFICFISMAFIYCHNWISGALLLLMVYIPIEVCFFMYPWETLDKFFATFNLFLGFFSICSTLIFYEYQRRQNFYKTYKINIQKEKTNKILNNIPLGIIVTENKKIIEINKTLKTIITCKISNQNNLENSLNLSNDPFSDNENILKIMENFKQVNTKETLKTYIEASKELNENAEFYFKNFEGGKEIPYEVTTTKIEAQEGGQIIFTLKNMAAYHELNEIKARQKYSTMFISSISHDFRTHLNIIAGNLDLINTSNSIDNTQKENLQAICKSTSFLSILVQDLLDFSFLKEKKFKLNLSNFNIVGLIDELCSLFAEKFMDKGLFLETIIPNQIPDEIHSDKMRVTQVISNLLSNSWKFTIRGGVYVKLNYDQSKNLMLLSVKDTGIGIAPENISRVMKPFLRIEDSMHLNENGIGLGLNISKKIAKKLNGSINISSEVGVGSEFVFSFKVFNFPHGDTVSEICKEERIDYSHILKIGQPLLLNQEESLSSERSSLNNGSNDPSFSALVSHNKNTCNCPKILIVDDEIGNRNVLTNYCKRLNILSEQAINGFEALQSVEMYPTSHNCCHNYKLILMDSNMPIMNGEESSLKIRQFINQSNFENPIIICITANAMKNKDNAQDELQYIYDDIYFKPLRFDTFKEIVHKYNVF